MHRRSPDTAGFPGFSVKGNPGRVPLFAWLKRLLAVALILLMQGPAMLVQEVAWAGMLVSYTQERGWKRGVVETFDGNHPCGLCMEASRIRENEERKDPMERRNEAQRFRLSWAEMVASTRLILPAVSECELIPTGPPRITHCSGRGADSPVPPPPEPA